MLEIEYTIRCYGVSKSLQEESALVFQPLLRDLKARNAYSSPGRPDAIEHVCPKSDRYKQILWVALKSLVMDVAHRNRSTHNAHHVSWFQFWEKTRASIDAAMVRI